MVQHSLVTVGVLQRTIPRLLLVQLGEACPEAHVPDLELIDVHPYLIGLFLPQERLLLRVLVVLELLVVEHLVRLQPLHHVLLLLISEMEFSLGLLLLDLLIVEKVLLREVPLRQ